MGVLLMLNSVDSKPKLINPIDSILKTLKQKDSNVGFSLFQTNKEEVDLKSDVIFPEDVYISVLKSNDSFLESKGLKPVYSFYLENLLRVRFSMDRKSRSEYVDINKKDTMSDGLQKLGSIQNLTEVRK